MGVLAKDPIYQAFQRTRAARQREIEAEKIRQLAKIKASREMKTLGLIQDRDLGQRQVDSDYLSRGLYRSGGRIEDRATVQDAFQQDRAELELGALQDASDTRAGATSELNALANQETMQRASALERENQRRIREAEARRAQQEAIYARQQYDAQLAFQRSEHQRALAASSARQASSSRSRTPYFPTTTPRRSGGNTGLGFNLPVAGNSRGNTGMGFNLPVAGKPKPKPVGYGRTSKGGVLRY